MSCSSEVTEPAVVCLTLIYSIELVILFGILGKVLRTWWQQKYGSKSKHRNSQPMNWMTLLLFCNLLASTIAVMILSVIFRWNIVDDLYGKMASTRIAIAHSTGFVMCCVTLPNLFIYQLKRAFANSAYEIKSQHIVYYHITYTIGFGLFLLNSLMYFYFSMVPKWIYLVIYALTVMILVICGICLFKQMLSRLISTVTMSHRHTVTASRSQSPHVVAHSHSLSTSISTSTSGGRMSPFASISSKV